MLRVMRSSTNRELQSVIAVLVRAGAPGPVAESIGRVLLCSGLSAHDARDWLTHPELAYPHPQPAREYGGVLVDGLVAGSVWCLSQGREDVVLEGARTYAAASECERLIARLFAGNIADVRRLTGADETRAGVIGEIAMLMQQRLGDPRRVARAASAMVDGDGDRIRDRLMRGEELQVLRELQSGALDLDTLARSRDLDPTW